VFPSSLFCSLKSIVNNHFKLLYKRDEEGEEDKTIKKRTKQERLAPYVYILLTNKTAKVTNKKIFIWKVIRNKLNLFY